MEPFHESGAYSLASHIAPRENGKDFALDGVDLMKKRLEDGDDFFAVNPKGQVPALLLGDGTLLTGDVAIMQYLANDAPDRQLLAPTSSLSRYKTIEWPNYIATELHESLTPLFRPNTPEGFKPTVRALLERKMQYVNDSLKDNQWVCGSRFSITDVYLFTILRWAYAVKLNMAGLGNIDAYMARIAEHPVVAAALRTEGLN